MGGLPELSASLREPAAIHLSSFSTTHINFSTTHNSIYSIACTITYHTHHRTIDYLHHRNMTTSTIISSETSNYIKHICFYYRLKCDKKSPLSFEHDKTSHFEILHFHFHHHLQQIPPSSKMPPSTINKNTPTVHLYRRQETCS